MNRETLQRALEALQLMQMEARARNCGLKICDDAIDEIRVALRSQPQGEPKAIAEWENYVNMGRGFSVGPTVPSSMVAVPREKLEHWREYWNGSANERAMQDALEHILGEVDDLLAAPKGGE